MHCSASLQWWGERRATDIRALAEQCQWRRNIEDGRRKIEGGEVSAGKCCVLGEA